MSDRNESISEQLSQEIETARTQHRVTPDIMLLVKALDEIERLEEALALCAERTEDLFRWINETRGEKVQIVKIKAS